MYFRFREQIPYIEEYTQGSQEGDREQKNHTINFLQKKSSISKGKKIEIFFGLIVFSVKLTFRKSRKKFHVFTAHDSVVMHFLQH